MTTKSRVLITVGLVLFMCVAAGSATGLSLNEAPIDEIVDEQDDDHISDNVDAFNDYVDSYEVDDRLNMLKEYFVGTKVNIDAKLNEEEKEYFIEIGDGFEVTEYDNEHSEDAEVRVEIHEEAIYVLESNPDEPRDALGVMIENEYVNISPDSGASLTEQVTWSSIDFIAELIGSTDVDGVDYDEPPTESNEYEDDSELTEVQVF